MELGEQLRPFFLGIFLMAIFGAIGHSMATARNRDPVLWMILCALTGIVGVLVLAAIGNEKQAASGYIADNYTTDASYNQNLLQTPPKTNTAQPVAMAKKYDVEKWKTLVEIDPDIAAANSQIAEHGENYVDDLATKYLTLSDKNYLPAIVTNVLEKVQKDAAEKEQLVVKRAAMAADGKLKSVDLLEAYQTSIKLNGGKDADVDLMVKSAAIYEGTAKAFEGNAIKVVFVNGTAMLRGKTFKRTFSTEAEADTWGL